MPDVRSSTDCGAAGRCAGCRLDADSASRPGEQETTDKQNGLLEHDHHSNSCHCTAGRGGHSIPSPSADIQSLLVENVFVCHARQPDRCRPTVDSCDVTSWLFLVAYTCSGLAGLVYEVTWTRLLTLYLGHTTAAASAVVAAFLGGLAIGAAIGGRVASNWTPRRCLQAYVALEIAVAICALLLPFELTLFCAGASLGLRQRRRRCDVSAGPHSQLHRRW